MGIIYRNVSPNGPLTTTYGVYGPGEIIHNSRDIPAKVLLSWVNAKPHQLIKAEKNEDGERDDLETRLRKEKARADAETDDEEDDNEAEEFETEDEGQPNPGDPPSEEVGFKKPTEAKPATPAKPAKPAKRR